MAKNACPLLDVHVSSERLTLQSSSYTIDSQRCQTIQTNMTYWKHRSSSINSILTHLHDPLFDSMVSRNVQWQSKTSVLKKVTKLWTLNLFKWLITGHNPLNQQLLKFLLVELGFLIICLDQWRQNQKDKNIPVHIGLVYWMHLQVYS